MDPLFNFFVQMLLAVNCLMMIHRFVMPLYNCHSTGVSYFDAFAAMEKIKEVWKLESTRCGGDVAIAYGRTVQAFPDGVFYRWEASNTRACFYY